MSLLEPPTPPPHTHTQAEILGALKRALVDIRPTSFDDCIKWARETFEEYFHNTIAQLLYNFPADHVSHVTISLHHVIIAPSHVTISLYHVTTSLRHVIISLCHVTTSLHHVIITLCHVTISLCHVISRPPAQVSYSGPVPRGVPRPSPSTPEIHCMSTL